MEDNAECMLVLIGATPEGKKELVGFQIGVRESAQSCRELLIDIKQRGFEIAPDLDVGAAKTSAVQNALEAELAVVDGMNSQAYKDRTLNRDKLRLAVAKEDGRRRSRCDSLPAAEDTRCAGDGRGPSGAQRHLVQRHRVPGSPSRAVSPHRPRRRRSACRELLGLDYTEPKLLGYAYAFEQATRLRKPPKSTPPLPGEP